MCLQWKVRSIEEKLEQSGYMLEKENTSELSWKIPWQNVTYLEKQKLCKDYIFSIMFCQFLYL